MTVLDLTGSPDSWNAIADFCREWADLSPEDGLAFLLPAFSSARTDAAADIAVRHGAASVILSGARNGAEVQRLDMALRVTEIRSGSRPGEIAIAALADAAGILAAGSFERCSDRLKSIGWEGGHDPLSDTARFAAAAMVLAASAAGMAAIDALSLIGDATILPECERAKANGFSGKFCRSRDQVPIINRVFSF